MFYWFVLNMQLRKSTAMLVLGSCNCMIALNSAFCREFSRSSKKNITFYVTQLRSRLAWEKKEGHSFRRLRLSKLLTILQGNNSQINILQGRDIPFFDNIKKQK